MLLSQAIAPAGAETTDAQKMRQEVKENSFDPENGS
jgi:hypothetical protein